MQDFEISPENKFISNYMVIQKIETGEFKNCYLAEDMRTNKEVWITEFFLRSGNVISDKWLSVVSEIKKISLPFIVQISDFFREGDSLFVVSEIPKGKILKPMERYDEDRFRKIGGDILRALLLLQRNGIGLDFLSINDIFVDDSGEINLLMSEGWSLKPEKESRQKEIDLFAKTLLSFLGFKHEEKIEITPELLKELLPEKIYPLFEEILITHQVHRFESLSRYFQEKIKMRADSVMDTDVLEVSVFNRVSRYVILGILAVVIYMMFSSSNDISKSKWFDVWRYQVLANMGMSEPQRILGELYEKGYGVDKDMTQSIEWYRKAAQNGNVYAQMSLGHFYDKGIGVSIDKKQALYWFTLAATNGDQVAKENVALMSRESKKETDKNIIIKKEVSTSLKLPVDSFTEPSKGLASVMENTVKDKEINYHRFHTYWLHSGSSNNLKHSDQYGGIYGCYENGLKNPVEIVSFNHEVRSMAVDGEGNLYWADITTGQIMKSDLNGQNIRAIVGKLSHPMGIAIDRQRRILFWSDRQQNNRGFSGGIGRSDLDGNNVKYIVVNDLRSGGKLKIDEQEAKLYIPDIEGRKIIRVNEDGQNLIGLVFAVKPEGFDLDTQRRKMYWTDDMNSGIYESDYDGRNKRIVYTYYTTDENFETVMFNPNDQRIYFGKLSPGSQSIWSVALSSEYSVHPFEYVTNFKIHDIIKN